VYEELSQNVTSSWNRSIFIPVKSF